MVVTWLNIFRRWDHLTWSGDLTLGDLDLKFSGKLRNSCPNSYAKPLFSYREKNLRGLFTPPPPVGRGLRPDWTPLLLIVPAKSGTADRGGWPALNLCYFPWSIVATAVFDRLWSNHPVSGRVCLSVCRAGATGCVSAMGHCRAPQLDPTQPCTVTAAAKLPFLPASCQNAAAHILPPFRRREKNQQELDSTSEKFVFSFCFAMKGKVPSWQR